MEQTSNIIISVIFLAMSVWLFYGVSKTRNLIFKDKLWNTYRVLFAIAGGLCLLTGFLYTSVWDLIRLVLMTLCVI